MKRFDIHIHTPYCGHATGSSEETIQYAIQNKFDIIGFSEHFPYPEGFEEPIPDCVVPGDQWALYMDEIKKLQSIYINQIEIRIGAEIDYLPGYEKEIKKHIQKYPFDYIYGSIHLIDNIGIDYTEPYLLEHIEELGGVDTLWDKYWQSMERLINMGSCDILAHLDLPKKLKSAQPTRDQTDGFRHILELIKKNNLVMEFNTGGIDRTYRREAYPSREILQHASEVGIEVTLGSDSHASNQIGRYFDQAIDLLKAYGWKKLVLFKNRQKEYVELYSL